MLVLTGMDYGQKNILLEQAKIPLNKLNREQAGGGENCDSGTGRAIKLELTFLADSEEALLADGYVNRSKSGAFSRGSQHKCSSVRGNWRNNPSNPEPSQK